MKSTYLVLGAVLVAGILAFVAFRSDGDDPDGGPETPSLRKEQPSANGAAGDKEEEAATRLVSALGLAERNGEAAKAKALEKELRKEAWGSVAARRWALRRGQALDRTRAPEGTNERLAHLHRVRVLLSRGIYLPEMFGPDGTPTPVRKAVIKRVQQLNQSVMGGTVALEGVTTVYTVPQGIRPVQIVARQGITAPDANPMRMGPNAVLYWNQGSLDPKRLRAGSRFLLPLEELTLEVHLPRYRVGIFIGQWFVKEFPVGVGAPDSPTPVGLFMVHSKEVNPDWYSPDNKVIPFGHPDNELGTRWIKIHGDTLSEGRGIGIHGTNNPATIGKRVSNGCVRLHNKHVEELYWWVRTGNGGGHATRIHVFPFGRG